MPYSLFLGNKLTLTWARYMINSHGSAARWEISDMLSVFLQYKMNMRTVIQMMRSGIVGRFVRGTSANQSKHKKEATEEEGEASAYSLLLGKPSKGLQLPCT